MPRLYNITNNTYLTAEGKITPGSTLEVSTEEATRLKQMFPNSFSDMEVVNHSAEEKISMLEDKIASLEKQLASTKKNAKGQKEEQVNDNEVK